MAAVIFHASTEIMPRVLNIGVFNTSTWLVITGLTWLAALLLYWLTRNVAMVTDPGAERANPVKVEPE